jgi:hypothetical protein
MSAPPTTGRPAFDRALYQKIRAVRRGEKGLCARCPGKAAEDRTLCGACLEKARGQYKPNGAPRGRKLQPRGDRWAKMFSGGMTPGQIARAEGVDASLVRCALKVRGLWPVATVKP